MKRLTSLELWRISDKINDAWEHYHRALSMLEFRTRQETEFGSSEAAAQVARAREHAERAFIAFEDVLHDTAIELDFDSGKPAQTMPTVCFARGGT